MSKAILLVDMPRVCSECDLFKNYYDDEHEEWYYACALLETKIDSDVAEEKKCDNCPLKPMPERTNPLKVDCSNLLAVGYMHGRNDLINEIFGEE